MGLLILDHCACLLLRNRFDFEFELSRPQGLVKWQKVICASWFLVLFCLFLTIMFLLCFSWSLLSFFKSFLLQNGWQTVAVAFGLLGHLILVRVNTLLDSSKTSSLQAMLIVVIQWLQKWWIEKSKPISGVYSKVSIIRPGRSRLLEFEKKDSAGRLIETFPKYPDQVVYDDCKQVNE